VAQEITNPLNFIVGNLQHTEDYIQGLVKHLQLYQRHYPHPSPEIENHAEEIDLKLILSDLPQIIASMKTGTDRISKTSTFVRTFSRSSTKYKENFNIHKGINSTLIILDHRLKANVKRPAIKIIQEYGNLPLIYCYGSQLNQVFMNILTNA
ncbi:MAG: hybrid sensor histidine kinase/response regulator, partial [Nostoc sp.]